MDYLPRRDSELLDFAQNLSLYGSANCSRWLAPNPESLITEPLDDFEAKYLKSKAPNSGSVDKRAKNVAKPKLVKALRDYIQGFVARNPYVTEDDKVAMRLPVYDREPTVVTDPVGVAAATVKYPNVGALELHLRHDETTPADTKANYGYRIYFGVYASGEMPPTSGKDLRESIFARKKKVLFSFQPEDSTKTAYFCIRYENSKGKTGQWGKLFSATIP